VEYAGLSTEEKLIKVRSLMQASQVDVLHVAMLEEIAWVLNLRLMG